MEHHPDAAASPAPGRATRLARGALLTLGVVLSINAAWLAAVRNLNTGTALVGIAAMVFLAWGVYFPLVSRSRVVTAVLLSGCAAVVGLSAFLGTYGSRDDVTFDEDAVIVLGAAVHGDELSNTLRSRLDAALAYHRHNPKALIVVSGGQGPRENLSEAAAMRAYLEAAGVSPGQILAEDRSTSTAENFVFSKRLLDARLGPDYRVAFVTSDFHVYRAGRIAAAAGVDARHAHSVTPPYFWASMYLRECLAVAASWAGR